MREAYKTDLTDEQWAVIEPLLPPARPGGRRREAGLREVVNTILYQAKAGCQWDMLPHDLSPKSTAHDYFARWRDDGTLQEVVGAMRTVAEGREESPSAACIDSQSVKSTEVGGVVGYDGGKKVKGRKRHIVVDKLGLLMAVAVTAANVDEGTHAALVPDELDMSEYPRLKVVYADKKYNNDTLERYLRDSGAAYEAEVVTKKENEKGFKPLKIRRVNEQVFGCPGRYRRLSKDYEYTTTSGESWVRIAAISRMLRRLKPDPHSRQAEFKYPKPSKVA